MGGISSYYLSIITTSDPSLVGHGTDENASLSDVGSYAGGKPENPTYHESVARWCRQYGASCPMFRQHGGRDHTCLWFHGPEVKETIEEIIKLRHAMKPYFAAQLHMLNETGKPFERPLMWDFPRDEECWELAELGIGDSDHRNAIVLHTKGGGTIGVIHVDQYMVGDDY